MVWWCDKHKQHSCDDVCWQCDDAHDQPYIDAFNAGWDTRHETRFTNGETPNKKKEEQLHEWKVANQDLLLRRVRGLHE